MLTSDSIPKLNSVTIRARSHAACNFSSEMVSLKAWSASCRARSDHAFEALILLLEGGFNIEDEREFINCEGDCQRRNQNMIGRTLAQTIIAGY
jgi:hypothetical protein